MQSLDGVCSKNRPLLVMGTAFLFVHLLDHMAKKQVRFTLPTGSRVLETGGYKGRSRLLSRKTLHQYIEERLGVRRQAIVCEYGMAELSSQAYDSEPEHGPETGCFVFPPWARAQIISPETGAEVPEGETGLIRVVDLANVFSVLAVQTADLAIKRGHGFELLGRAPKAEPRGCALMSKEDEG
jgi:hypothetical protein